jgi:uncharacterized metal-binding protein YceD (DUF177 family)
MKNLKEYFVQFAGLKIGKHQFDYQIDNKFFELFDFDEFNNALVSVELILDKKNTMLELHFIHKGTVNVPCDVTNEDFDLPIKGKNKLIISFGDTFNDDNEELLVLPHGEFQVDVSRYIYENIVLSVPSKRVHPGIKDGTLKTDALDILENLSPNQEQEENHDIDPRWENLKKLLTDK